MSAQSNLSWQKQVSQILQATQSSVILLYGNVKDYFPFEKKYGSLTDYILQSICQEKDYKFFYDPQAGIQFITSKDREDFFKSLQGYDAYHKTNFSSNPPKQPGPAFSLIENITKLKIIEKLSVCSVINYIDQILPPINNANINSELRYTTIAVDKWAQNSLFIENDVTIFLIVENLANIADLITRNSFIARVYIPHPDEKVRSDFSQIQIEKREIQTKLTHNLIAKLTAGLSLVQLSRLFAFISLNKITLDIDSIKNIKKKFIESECTGLLEFVEPRYDLSYVAGHVKAKELLKNTSTMIQKGKTEYLPMGYLICGPVGTGKTFLVNCFAGEVGIPTIKFLNFRSQWQGQTEANLEKILNLLKAVNPVVVMIDEADAFLGSRNMQGDSGTSSRVFASLAAFMGDTQYRGRIIWFLMTSRSDLLPIDMKRQGRAEEHIALFHTQNEQEEEDLFQALAKKNKINVSNLKFALAHSKKKSYSGADIEAILVRAAMQSQLKNEKMLSQETLTQITSNFMSPNYALETELQILVAIRECTNRQLIPKQYQNKSSEDISTRINTILALLHE